MKPPQPTFTNAARLLLLLGVLLPSGIAAVSAQQPNELERARSLYQQTRFDEARQVLERIQPKTAPVYALLGQNYYMLEEYKKATDALERAVTLDAGNSVYYDWLGRAFGRRAETSFPLTAPSYASRARQHFEKAVALDPENLDATDDLFEYYLQAPGFLGGGVDKAEELSERVRERAPAKYHSMQARIAEKQKRVADAERHLKEAVSAAPSEPGRLADLGRFLARQGRYADSDAAFDEAERVAPNHAPLKFQRARAYIDSGRNSQMARRLLQEYISSTLGPEDPTRAEAQRLLDKLPRS